MDNPGQVDSPGRRVAWKSVYGTQAPLNESPIGGSRGSSMPNSRTNSRANSGPNSPISSARGSYVDIPGEMIPTERPPNKRSRSKFGWQASRPRYHRSKSSNQPAGARPIGESAVPSTAIARLALRTQNNLRMWYLRHSNIGVSRRRTEVEKLREIEKSQLLFAQMFAVSPMVLISASSLQPEEGHEKKVPVVMQQLSIKVTEEYAKHYRNMLRIHLEYGSGLGLIKWEILRGYRDLIYLRTKLKARSKNRVRTKKVKLPKLPRPKNFGFSDKKAKAGIDDSDEDESEESSSDEEEGDELDELEAHLNQHVSAESEGDLTNSLAECVSATNEDETAGGLPLDEHPHEHLSSDPQYYEQRANGLAAHENAQGTAEERNFPSSNQRFEEEGSTCLSSGQRRASRTSGNDEGAESAHASNAASPDMSQSHPPAHHHAHHGRRHSRQSYAHAVQDWLNRIKYIYTFRPDTNDLMQFLEFSHLSLKLSSEYSFHGKEGTMIVRSRASEMGWHVNHWHPRDIKDMIERHTKKWVLVRDSYLVIVDNIYSTRIREVFLVDSSFHVKHISEEQGDRVATAIDSDDLNGVVEALPDATGVHKKKAAKSVFLHLTNNERTLKLATTSERDLRRWQASILQMKSRSPWSKKNRFDSFAPVRKNVFGQWFVDGRDYMWVLSEAMENARDTIFILDWWLSPELYLRRPPEGNQKWRLDRLLKRKAQQGVKIFVIVYRNVGPTIPIDSMWTKHSLIDLHENIHVMRSPNQLQNKGSLFWAHHEKLCVIDSTVAFNGGIDLCFGRWDTWEHTLTDDSARSFLPKNPTGEEWQEPTQLFPGKDYSNARVKDFFDLNRPFEDMYDRNNVPRMPWHDIHQMVVGQPARDLARHFVQRWNYVLRQKIPSRPTPLLLPPSDFSQEDLERLHLTGTCEYQVLRSSGEWSLGLKKHEQSIQNAYLQLIENSEHMVYIENQFFVTSTEVDGVLIENQIGNALVQRIVRAHENGEKWKAFILIPLMPGFEAEVDTDKASSVRVISQCQFNSISRGPHSIFYRLESLGIRPDQYINFFSLRKWGKFSDTPSAPNGGRVATELLYIHAKCMIVDDRIAIIGSANINERSMRGNRDSEVAVCVRDTKVVESKMAGKPYKASKFAHSLRMRLMREHLGVDIDKFEIVERFMDSLDATAERIKEHRSRHQHAHSHHGQPLNQHGFTPNSVPEHDEHPPHLSRSSASAPQPTPTEEKLANNRQDDMDQFPEWLYPELHSFNWYAGTSINRGVRDYKKFSHDSRVQNNAEHHEEVDGDGFDHWKERLGQTEGLRARAFKAAEPDIDMENQAREIMDNLLRDRSITTREQFRKLFYSRFTNQDIMRPVKRASDLPLPHTDEEGLKAVNNENIPIDPWQFEDPLDDQFFYDKWLAVAERNTLIFRLVFRCQPDDEVETWKDYKTFVGHLERFYEKQREDGGPNVLRKSGHHEPERVDKYVLDGSIKRPDPDTLRLNRIRATQTPHSPSSSGNQELNRENQHEAERNAKYDNTLKKMFKEDEYTEHQPHNNSKHPPNHLHHLRHTLHPHPHPLHPSHRHHFYPSHPHHHQHNDQTSPLFEQQDEGEDYFSASNILVPNQGSEFTAGRRRSSALAAGMDGTRPEYKYSNDEPQASNEIPNGGGNLRGNTDGTGPNGPAHSRVTESTNDSANGFANGDAYGSAANGFAANGSAANGSVANGSAVNGSAVNGSAANGSVNCVANGSADGAANGFTRGDEISPTQSTTQDSTHTAVQDQAPQQIAFPTMKEPEKVPLKPSTSSSSARRRAMTGSGMGGSPLAAKPARKWGHFEHVLDAQVAEDMLQGVTGHLVVFPTEWLNRELDSGNWNFQLDRIAPLEIYD